MTKVTPDEHTFKWPPFPAGESGSTFLMNIPVTEDPDQLRSTFPPTMEMPREFLSSRRTCNTIFYMNLKYHSMSIFQTLVCDQTSVYENICL